MAQNSSIEWTDDTFNPWWGCSKVSPACLHCYAETWAKRVGQTSGQTMCGSEPQWKISTGRKSGSLSCLLFQPNVVFFRANHFWVRWICVNGPRIEARTYIQLIG